MNEGAARGVLSQAIFDQEGQTYWIVVNSVRYPSRDWIDQNGSSIADMAAQGSVVEASTLDALAEKTGMNAENLKAAGEVTGGIHGSNRLGGNAIADCMTFGRKAGAAAASYE